jgi:NADH:ubiquinone oxidoreductase subunit F (NADH-binding)
VRLQPATGSFVGGEVRALLSGLSGAHPAPPGRRVLPTVSGLHGHPTFASNAETFAQLGLHGTHGPAWYGEVGTSAERGTTLLTLHGDVPQRGVLEAPMGTPLDRLLGAGSGPALVGGYHGTWLTATDGLVLDRAALRARGVMLGAGVLARLPETTCALAEVAAVARWLAGESAGQCGPCFFGLPAVAADLESLLVGRLPAAGLDGLERRLAQLPGRGACAHPDGAVMFTRTALDALTGELAQHLAHGGCGRPYSSVLPIEPKGGSR